MKNMSLSVRLSVNVTQLFIYLATGTSYVTAVVGALLQMPRATGISYVTAVVGALLQMPRSANNGKRPFKQQTKIAVPSTIPHKVRTKATIVVRTKGFVCSTKTVKQRKKDS